MGTALLDSLGCQGNAITKDRKFPLKNLKLFKGQWRPLFNDLICVEHFKNS